MVELQLPKLTARVRFPSPALPKSGSSDFSGEHVESSITQIWTKMLHALCMNTQTTKSTFVLTHSNDILRAMVGIKDIRVLNYKRSGSNVELMIEQVKGDVHCPNCKGRAQVKERLRDFYRTQDPDQARQVLEELKTHCLKKAMPLEVQRLGQTIRDWFDKICNYHLARVSNGPTEALNNLVKRIKRIGFGFRNFQNYRIRALLYAGKPNWRVLGSIVVR